MMAAHRPATIRYIGETYKCRRVLGGGRGRALATFSRIYGWKPRYVGIGGFVVNTVPRAHLVSGWLRPEKKSHSKGSGAGCMDSFGDPCVLPGSTSLVACSWSFPACVPRDEQQEGKRWRVIHVHGACGPGEVGDARMWAPQDSSPDGYIPLPRGG